MQQQSKIKESWYQRNKETKAREYYEKNKERIKERKRKYREKNKDKIKAYMDKWHEENREHSLEYSRKRREEFPEKFKEAKDKYKNKPEKKLKEKLWRREYYRRRSKNDPQYIITNSVRKLFGISFKRQLTKKEKSFFKYTNISFEEYINHFKNLEYYNEWINKENIHIDHIKPLATAKTAEDVVILCHYTNLQPLFIKDNILKSDNLIEKQLRLI